MSLTSMLKTSDIRQKFNKEFPIIENPCFKCELLAAPQTTRYAMIGTAFDYLLRFYIKRINPHAKEKSWIAEEVASDPEYFSLGRKDAKKISDIVNKAKELQKYYIKNGKMTDEILRSCIGLAQIDPVFRAGYTNNKELGNADPMDLADLKNLLKLVKPESFGTRNVCLLNPTFGKASELVGGADVDLVLDDAIVDIKTIMDPKKRYRDDLNQIIGYYILHRIGGIDGAPKEHKINTLGIYYSRHGVIVKFPVKDVVNEKTLPTFIAWFKRRAEKAEEDGFF